MVTDEVRKKYVPTIGIETHVQLKSKTKLFAAIGNDARDAAPNTLISHICVGMPGALPVLNEGALKLAARAAYALGTLPQKFSHFDRKHYFYPDLPKGYQITQYSNPIIIGGKVEIQIDGQTKTINITRAHLEEDAGKTTHPDGADYSLVDLNRAGTPLLEIVSEPEINSPAEAKAYVRELYLLMKYADVSEVDLFHGNMRFDVNVSVSKEQGKFGTRSEVKNLNSFKSVEGAAEYEIERQIELLEKGEKVTQETRGWDEATQKTTSQRGKEEAEDYRYMPEPDIPPLELSDEFISRVEAEVPTLPTEYRQKLQTLEITPQVIEDILYNRTTTELVVRVLNKAGQEHARRVAFWQIQAAQNQKILEAASMNKLPIKDEDFIELSTLVSEGNLSSSAASQVHAEMLATGGSPQEIISRLGLMQVSDEAELEAIVKTVIAENKKAADDVAAGEMKAIGFLVGQVMKASGGKANPTIVQEIIKKQLGA